jgi:Zn-dependent protease with chaperone function
MNCKTTIARSLSRILFATLYVIDIVGLYYISGDVSLAMSGAVAIWVILFIQMGISLLSLRVHSLTNSKRGDAEYLRDCMDEVLSRSEYVGRKRKKIRLWIADNESLNAYNIANNIIVNRSLLQVGDMNMLEGLLAHELSHAYCCDWWFTALLSLNVFIGICYAGVAFLGAAIVVFLIVALLVGLLFSSWLGVIAGGYAFKFIKSCFKLFTRGFYYITKLFSAFLSRRQENEADRYACLLGYGSALLNFFRLAERVERHSVEKSWIEDLLSEHPTNYIRTNRIERMQEVISRQEEELHESLPYENPF